MERLDSALDNLKKEDVLKMRPQTSAAVDASEIRYTAYWRACRKEFFDADIVQAKAQIVLAKVKPPKAEVNPWAVGLDDSDDVAGYKKLYRKPRTAPGHSLNLSLEM